MDSLITEAKSSGPEFEGVLSELELMNSTGQKAEIEALSVGSNQAEDVANYINHKIACTRE